MIRYHQIMQYVYIAATLGILVYTTYLGWQSGFGKIWGMYLFTVATVIQFFRHKIQYKKLKAYIEQENNATN